MVLDSPRLEQLARLASHAPEAAAAAEGAASASGGAPSAPSGSSWGEQSWGEWFVAGDAGGAPRPATLVSGLAAPDYRGLAAELLPGFFSEHESAAPIPQGAADLAESVEEFFDAAGPEALLTSSTLWQATAWSQSTVDPECGNGASPAGDGGGEHPTGAVSFTLDLECPFVSVSAFHAPVAADLAEKKAAGMGQLGEAELREAEILLWLTAIRELEERRQLEAELGGDSGGGGGDKRKKGDKSKKGGRRKKKGGVLDGKEAGKPHAAEHETEIAFGKHFEVATKAERAAAAREAKRKLAEGEKEKELRREQSALRTMVRTLKREDADEDSDAYKRIRATVKDRELRADKYRRKMSIENVSLDKLHRDLIKGSPAHMNLADVHDDEI